MAAKDQPNKLPPGVDMLDMPAGIDKDRFEEVLKIKEQANDKYRALDYFSAKCLYSGCLEMLERCCLHLDRADEVWEGIKNNMALCDLKRQEWGKAVETTTEILARNPKNTKALYRRGVARIGQSKLRDAREDLEVVVEMEPENIDARQKLVEVLRQLKADRAADKSQADKMRGFLRGERLDDSVAISEDGGVRKLHGNENAPLFASWIKREWLQPKSGFAGVVTAHIIIKTTDGKEVFNTRKAPGALSQQLVGPGAATQPKPAERPAEPARWVVDDATANVFSAWNAAVKTLQLHQLGQFEVTRYTMGPSVEPAVQRCITKWLLDSVATQEMFKDVPEDVKSSTFRKQALQILSLPEEFCAEEEKEPNTTLKMEMELLEADEYMDLDGEGRQLIRIFREGKKKSPDVPVVDDYSTVAVHFRISKLLSNYALKDTRLGLATGEDGLVLRTDRTKEPAEFIVGEEAAASEGDFVPPCIGECLMLPPGGAVEGMHFEVVLRDGVPIRYIDKNLHNAYADGKYAGLPDTTGPVSIKIEVEKVVSATAGPSHASWQGVEQLDAERKRADELETLDEGRHRQMALKRWHRVIVWLEQLLDRRKWKLQQPGAVDSMYDLEWEDEKKTEECSNANGKFQFDAPPRVSPGPSDKIEPELFEAADELLKQLQQEELCQWARAHSGCARILGVTPGQQDLSRKHARCAVQACTLGQIPADVEISCRSTLAERLAEVGKSAEALEVLKVAQALDPKSIDLKDQAAILTQKDNDIKSVSTREALISLKKDVNDSLEANDVAGLQMLMAEIDGLPLTWDVASETAIGKEVGKCAKHADEGVSTTAKNIISKLHRLAKAERPMWVR